MKFIETPIFTRLVLELLPDDEYRELQFMLADNPSCGDIIQGGGGIRKVRFSAKGKGKIGAVSLQHLDGVHHPQDFMFRSLSHEEKGQGVTGKMEEPLPLPGGADLRVRNESCCREVRREDGPSPVYVPHELGMLALHSLGCVECSEHVRPLPCVHGAGAGQQEHCRVVLSGASPHMWGCFS